MGGIAASLDTLEPGKDVCFVAGYAASFNMPLQRLIVDASGQHQLAFALLSG
jgi:hypothetical protein